MPRSYKKPPKGLTKPTAEHPAAGFRTTWRKRKLKQKKCARGSYRVLNPNKKNDTRIVVCCPPGKWSATKQRCGMPMQPHLEYKKPKKR